MIGNFKYSETLGNNKVYKEKSSKLAFQPTCI